MAAGKGDKPGAIYRATRYLAPPRKNGLPRLLAMTDPHRAPDPFAALAVLPQGTGLIWRTYGMDVSRAEIAKLARAARAKRCLLLLAGPAAQSGMPDIGGIHIAGHGLSGPYTDRISHHSRFIMTAAAHSQRAIVAAARLGVDAVLISPVFATASHPGAATLGVTRFAQLARFALSLGLAVYALGGVTAKSRVRRLRGSGASGLAGIGFHLF